MNGVYIIAEMASSHDGSAELARTIIDGAGAAGADAVQLQVWSADRLVVPGHADLPTLRRIELSSNDWASLVEYARNRWSQMQVIACVYDLESAALCHDLGVDAFKLHSADLSNPRLVQGVASFRRRIDLSVGASTIEEIRQAIDWIKQTSDAPIWLMYGLQNFPTPPSDVELAYMKKLGDLFELPLGYQDHSDAETDAAYWLPCVAVGQGVRILEKHMTHDRSLKGVDHQAALNPDEFARFVAMVRTVEQALGDGRPRAFSAAELRYRRYSKKSMVSARDITAGSRLEASDILFRRATELGLPPDRLPLVAGRILKRSLSSFELIREDDVE